MGSNRTPEELLEIANQLIQALRENPYSRHRQAWWDMLTDTGHLILKHHIHIEPCPTPSQQPPSPTSEPPST